MDPIVSPTFIVGLIATAASLGAVAGLLRASYRVDRVDKPADWSTPKWKERRALCRVLRWGCAAVAVCILGIAALAFYPYRWEYHSYAPVDGMVTAVDVRQIADGDGGMRQVYAVRYPDGRVYRCDDTRCAGVTAGDRLRLRCIREWDWVANDGWRCAFIHHWPAEVTR